ncbi:MAG: DEAD/DEAH box helicase [Parachlamydiales bacterium]|nr:DEAD/DEAH box helicase [Parachlamydiales bacterium]
MPSIYTLVESSESSYFFVIVQDDVKKTSLMANQATDPGMAQFLVKEKERFVRLHPKVSIPPFHIPITAGSAQKALSALFATAKLYCKGKKLLYDRFRPLKINFDIEEIDNHQFAVEPFFTGNNKILAKEDIDFLFKQSPAFVVSGAWLYPIDEALDVCWITKDSEIWDQKKWNYFQDMKKLDPDSVPPYTLKSKPLEAKTMGNPTLKLVDPRGAFANLQTQESEKDLIEAGYIKKAHANSQYYCPIDRVNKTLQFLLEMGWTVLDSLNRSVTLQKDIQLQVEPQGDILQVKGQVHFSDGESTIESCMGAYKRKENFLSLGPQTVGLIDYDKIQARLGPLLHDEFLSSGLKIPKTQYGLLEDIFEPKEVCSQKIQTLSLNQFKGQLRPYQQQGVEWLNKHANEGHGALLADDMGLGKTVQVLAFLSTIKTANPHLIIVPTSLMFNWESEIKRFVPDWKILCHHGVERFSTLDSFNQYNAVVTSYSLLRQDIDLLKQISWQCVVLDEANAIKNSGTQTAQAALSLKAAMRISMTGTPVENSLEELWSHYHFLVPNLLGTKSTFNQKIQDPLYLQGVKKRIKPFFLRRKKEEVAKDLPEKILQTVEVEMSIDQAELYNSFVNTFKQGLLKKIQKDGVSSHRMEILEALLRLRQICCHSSLVKSDCQEGGGKWDMLFDDLEELKQAGHKVLVFSQFTSVLKLMKQEAEKRNWPYLYLDGQTKNRQEVVESFQQGNCDLFFLSMKAAGVGLNLTQADYVLLYDPWWNEAMENQAIDRAHRIGQTNTVYAKRYITKGTIEEKIAVLKSSKSQMAEDIFAESSNLKLDDVEFLLN